VKVAKMGWACDYDEEKECIQNCDGETPTENTHFGAVGMDFNI
jgi:hypothetical protein